MNAEMVKPVSDVRMGAQHIYRQAVGDTWDPAWSDDGFLYFPGNDGSGWHKACSNNVFFNRVAGEDIHTLAGETINCLAEYDGWAQEGPDGSTWKSSGCISVDGVLYFAVSRHTYGTKSGDPFGRQPVRKASIIKSEDRGLSWTRSVQDNLTDPMFPDGRFGTPYFIHYGQDGETFAVDGADRFIYAISNNGFWCNGDNYILGRVARDRLGRLDRSDWVYYQGGDGALDENWTPDKEKATLIIDNPLKCGETGATYIPALGRYVLVAWYYPGDPNVDTDETHLIFYESPKPWGPWTAVKEFASRPEGWYCPRLLSKWQRVGDGEVSAVLATGGDYYEMDKYYFFTVVELGLKAGGYFPPPPPEPKPVIVAGGQTGRDLNQFQYAGSWVEQSGQTRALSGGERFSAVEGDSFTLTFHGGRVSWNASKENNRGIAAVSIDGGDEVFVDQYTYCIVPQYGRLLYDSGLLLPGVHTLKVRVTGQKNKQSKGSSVYNDCVKVYG